MNLSAFPAKAEQFRALIGGVGMTKTPTALALHWRGIVIACLATGPSEVYAARDDGTTDGKDWVVPANRCSKICVTLLFITVSDSWVPRGVSGKWLISCFFL